MQTLNSPARFLFWAAPPPTGSEFTPEDPLALDYLAQQVGLWMLPRFTTRTSSAQYYAVVLYGLWLARKAQADYGLPHGDAQRLQLFERWERFWALSVLEARGGDLKRGDPDAFRGIRGAAAAWRPGDGKLPTDFPLISRQLELGGLGAYLSSLRSTGLLFPGSLQPSPAAHPILEMFWGPTGDRDHRSRYERYALHALDPRTTHLERKYGNLTLRRVGEASCLTAILARPEQQANFDRYLLAEQADQRTRAVASLVEEAARRSIVTSRDVLIASAEGQLVAIDEELRELLLGAVAFGDTLVALLGAFNAMYLAVRRQVLSSRAKIAASVFTVERLSDLQRVARQLLERECARDFRGLAVHGNSFVNCVSQLHNAGPEQALDAVLAFHRRVQRDRRRGNGWLVDDGEHLTIGPSNFAAAEEVAFPDLKLSVVRSLLRDVGRLTAPNQEAAA